MPKTPRGVSATVIRSGGCGPAWPSALTGFADRRDGDRAAVVQAPKQFDDLCDLGGEQDGDVVVIDPVRHPVLEAGQTSSRFIGTPRILPPVGTRRGVSASLL